MKPLSRLLVSSTMGAVLLTLVLFGTASAHTLSPHAVPDPQTLHGVAARPSTIPSLRLPPQIICCNGNVYNIYNDNAAGKCIGIDSSLYAGDWTCTSNNDQLWTPQNCKYGPNGVAVYCQLINLNNQCLGVAGASTQEGARIRGWTCNTSNDQWWSTESCTEDFVLINLKSGMIIGVQSGSTQNGAELVQWVYNGHLDQCWHSGLFS